MNEQPLTLLEGQRVYLLGPMTGYPDHNRPAFRRATELLRTRGVLVTSPDELDNFDQAAGTTWTDYMQRDLPWVCRAQVGVALPGWQQSKGANLEACVLNAFGRPVYMLDESGRTLTPVPPEQLPVPTIHIHRSPQ
jgi:hypothetical protein